MATNDGWNQDLSSYNDPAAETPGPAANTDPWSPDELAESQKWANDYYTSHQIPNTWGVPQDLANSYVTARRAGASHADAMAKLAQAPAVMGWDKFTAPGAGAGAGAGGTVTPPPTAPTAGAGGTIAPITGVPDWFPKAPADAPNLPTFQPGAKYQEPDYAAAVNDPAYQFEQGEGVRALEQSAAAHGVLNGGGTLKDVNAWGQNFAAQRVNDVRDRSVNNYLLNYQTQNVDPYKYAYQSALDTFNGANNTWQTKAQIAQRYEEDMWNRRLQVGLS